MKNMETRVTNITDSLRFQQLLDERVALGVLRKYVATDWKTLDQPTNLHIERYWPGRDGTLSIEWSFNLSHNQRYSLYVTTIEEGASPQLSTPSDREPFLSGKVLLGVSVYITDWRIAVHSPDCDPHLDQLGKCLDDVTVLKPDVKTKNDRSNNGNGNGHRSQHLTACLLGYRAGRRAAFRYSLSQVYGSTKDLFCKIYRDDRGHQLIRRHGQVSDQLRMMTHSRVRIPEPIRYDEQYRMAQFHWLGGQRLSIHSPDITTHLHLAAEALAVFHNMELDGLHTFTIEDEWQIVKRWMSLTDKIAPQHHQQLELLSTMLHDVSTQIVDDNQATVHRDYYPAQLLIDGDHIAILDLDTMARGHRCVDIGNFLAHLLLETIANDAHDESWSNLYQSFIRSYITHGGHIDSNVLTYYFSSSLIRIGMVHILRKNEGLVAEALWHIAKQLLTNPRGPLTIDKITWTRNLQQTAEFNREIA